MPLYHDLNYYQIQARVDHDSGSPYLVKVKHDPTGECILDEDYFYSNELIPHLLPLSNGLRTFRVEREDGQWAMWIEMEEKWVSCPAPRT